jgi:hypothetical protein
MNQTSVLCAMARESEVTGVPTVLSSTKVRW